VTQLGRPLPKEVIEHWPEIFGEVKLNVLPLVYLHAILVNFKDGKTWEIKIQKGSKVPRWEDLEKQIQELISSYEDNIDNIDFKLDSERVKKDIKKSTDKFLKKKKL